MAEIVERAQLGKRLTYFKKDDYPLLAQNFSQIEGVQVLKVHWLNNSLAQFIENQQLQVFYCFRDVIVSSINKGWLEHNPKVIKKATIKYINEFNKWKLLILRKFHLLLIFMT